MGHARSGCTPEMGIPANVQCWYCRQASAVGWKVCGRWGPEWLVLGAWVPNDIRNSATSLKVEFGVHKRVPSPLSGPIWEHRKKGP